MVKFNKPIKNVLNYPNEVWKRIEEQNAYISNYGRVKSSITNNMLTIHWDKNGYEYIILWNKNIQIKYLIHRLVAIAFVDNPNPKEFNVVNRINENKTDNRAENLEWCNSNYNNTYSKGYKIKRIDLSNGNISVFNSERKAGEAIGKSGTFIRRALLNNTVYNNYKWERI